MRRTPDSAGITDPDSHNSDQLSDTSGVLQTVWIFTANIATACEGNADE